MLIFIKTKKMKKYNKTIYLPIIFFMIFASCNTFIGKDNSGDYFNRTGDNRFVDSIFLEFKDKPSELFELEADYMINSSFDRFYSAYLKKIGKIGIVFDKKPRLYITKFSYALTDKVRSELLKNSKKYPVSFINTIKNNLPLYLFITSVDVNYSGGNKFEDAGFDRSQIGKAWGMANYGGGQGKIYSINFLYVDNGNSSDKPFKLSSYNSNNKYFGFIEIGKVSSKFSGVLDEESTGELKYPSFNFMKYEYSFHVNEKISTDYNKEHFENSENILIIELFSANNKFKNIDQLLENCQYTFYGEHIEINQVQSNLKEELNENEISSIEKNESEGGQIDNFEIKLTENGPDKIDLTKEVVGEIVNIIQYDGDYFLEVNDVQDGKIKIYMSAGSCHGVGDIYELKTEMSNEISKKLEDNSIGKTKLRIKCKSTYANFCTNNGDYKSIVWRPMKIEVN